MPRFQLSKMLQCFVFQKSEWNGETGCSYLLKNGGFFFGTFPGAFWSVAYYGQFWIVPFRLSLCPDGFCAIFGLLAEMGGRGSCCIGEIAELNGCCSCASGPSQAADLLCSGQFCDLFERVKTHFSSWSPLPVHTVISVGDTGFAGPLGHVAAAALLWNVHSDLPAASAAKATEYMLEPAAASVAAFLLDGQTDMLPVPAAKAFHCLECQSVKQTLQAAAAAAAIWVGSSFVAIVLHMSEWCWVVAGFWIGFNLLWNSCQLCLEKDTPASFGKEKKQGCTSKGTQESCYIPASGKCLWSFLRSALAVISMSSNFFPCALAGALPLRYCSTRFARYFPFWTLPVPGHVAGLITAEVQVAQVDEVEVALQGDSLGLWFWSW